MSPVDRASRPRHSGRAWHSGASTGPMLLSARLLEGAGCEDWCSFAATVSTLLEGRTFSISCPDHAACIPRHRRCGARRGGRRFAPARWIHPRLIAKFGTGDGVTGLRIPLTTYRPARPGGGRAPRVSRIFPSLTLSFIRRLLLFEAAGTATALGRVCRRRPLLNSAGAGYM